MKNSISKRSKLLYEFIDEMIAKRLVVLSEQQMPPPAAGDPNAALAPPADPLAADPMAGGAMPADPNAMPPADPAMAGTDPNAPPADDAAAGGEEGEADDAEPEGDPDSFVVDKIKEMVDENENVDATEVFNAAKGYIQDQKLLDPKKIHQALSIVEKLREEENPKLDDVANAIEEFLTNEFDI